jgi:hypothetical protein
MDCDTFENHVLDLLYEEADPATQTEAKRHADGCTRCSALYASLRGARSEARLVLEEPSVELEARILAATHTVHTELPLHRRVLRWLSWAGSHAMRPQFAMAAVLVLILGSSLLLLRARPGASGAGPVAVTERGVPAADEGEAPPPPVAAAPLAPAEMAAAAPADAEKNQGAEAGLAEAKATEERSGCAAAAPRFDDVAKRFPSSPLATAARWEAARCYASSGQVDRARELYAALGADPLYGSRAQGALATLPAARGGGAPAGGAGAAAALPAAAARPAPAKAAARSKADSNDAFEESERPPAAAAPPKAASPAANDVGF